MSIIDTHIHLDNEAYASDVDKVIQTALSEGVKAFLIPGADPQDLPKAQELSKKYNEVFFAAGVHPYDCENFDIEFLEKYASDPKCIAIGECGLDYYRLPENEDEKHLNKELQKSVFTAQIQLAKKLQKPLIVHIRDASNDSKKLLLDNDASKVGGVLHCYNASEYLLDLAQKDFYFGIGGVVTFKNAKKLVEVLPKIPKEKLLIETDGPYLTPHPFRGTRNEPKYTNLVAEKMAEILNLSVDEVKNLTTKNALNLFKEFKNIV
ncbi:MAG: TatD family hydrolase [Campylobacterota bacterium]|nr:TatD family hydrolase [Campylobacterota bacterium]